MMIIAKGRSSQAEDTYLVKRIRGGKRKRRQVRIGAADRALTPNAGMAACDMATNALHAG